MCITKLQHTLLNHNLKKLFYLSLYLDFFASRWFFWYSFSFCSFSSDILWYLFFAHSLFLFLSSSDKFLYLSLACSFNLSLSLSLSYNNLSLYLVSRFCFSDNKLCYSFFIYNKNVTAIEFFEFYFWNKLYLGQIIWIGWNNMATFETNWISVR